ncbi:hypothetical protein CEE45_06135 [Candidatus Heimdallarchaeota archaeon B3_Heim]|nr:MAG: hypothetical protein CEE45_06135 [Candidatus Heimdallarchaeota archaeon B3_Heim]
MLLIDKKQIITLGILLIIIQGITVICKGDLAKTLQQQESKSSSYDLNFNYTMDKPELTFNRFIVLSRPWDKLFLNLSIQNFGEPIDTILTTIKINDIITDHVFSSNEREGLKNCLVYQFDQPQALMIPLNYSYQEILSVSVSMYLDSLISWREVEYNFIIFSATVHAVDLVQPLSEQSLMILSSNFQYALQPSQISFFGKKILTKSLLPVDIPDNLYLSSILEITIKGGQFDYIALGTGRNHAIDGNVVRINSTVNKVDLENQIWHINLYIIPIISSTDDYSTISISIRAYGLLKEINTLNNNLESVSHPIPGFIMIPVLIFILFGIPYYYVYQEELSEKDDRIIDSDLGKM